MSDLQKFLSDISSIYWWVSVFIVGMVIEFTSETLYKLASRLIGKYVKNYRLKSEAKRTAEEKELDELVNDLMRNQYRLHMYQINILFRIISGTGMFLLGMMIVATIIFQFPEEYFTHFIPPAVTTKEAFEILFMLMGFFATFAGLKMLKNGIDKQIDVSVFLEKKTEESTETDLLPD